MGSLSKKQVFLAISVLVVVLIGSVVLFKKFYQKVTPLPPVVATKEETPEPVVTRNVIGHSVEGRNIESYSYGKGRTHLTFVGGIHGGYEWNSVLLAYTFIDYLKAHPEIIPENLTITVIPSANPDGLYAVTGKIGRFTMADVAIDKKVLARGRFNANKVDLNRNFDCKWKSESTWQSKIVSAGTSAFSEPEAKALQKFILSDHSSAVVFWHSQSNGVYASQCNKGILPETLTLMNTYANASLYPAIKTFDAYETTGAADDWLASVNIPTITVELKTHETIEWQQNLKGIKALIQHYDGVGR